MSLVALKKDVDRKIEALQEKAFKVYGQRVKPIDIRYDIKSTRVGGVAICNSYKPAIRLHPAALKEYGKKYIDDTVVHEYAHLLAHLLFPNAKRHHGVEWKSVMRTLGAEPNRCHTFDLPKAMANMGIKTPTKRTTKVHTYKCGCMTHKLSTVRHNRASLGKATYSCKLCGKALVKA